MPLTNPQGPLTGTLIFCDILVLMKKPLKLFVLTKYVTAISAAHAIRKEKDFEVDEIYLPDQWKSEHLYKIQRPEADAVGFQVED